MKYKAVTACLLALFIYSLAWAEPLKVKKVYSGEVVKLQQGKKVKYIGIDTPGQGDFFFKECTNANKKLVYNKKITIEYDVLKEDSAERLLGYVYVGDVFVNAQLLKNGYAIVYIVPPNKKYGDLFISLQKEARKYRRGIWAFEDPNDEPYYIASKNIKKFHRPGCRIAKDMSFDKRIIFRNKDEALAKGYSQDWRCNPLFRKQEENKQ
ncbi:MAG: thermonuclease family protein [Proteobacteria bacterium]|nr:thermonuclease family protein [Pseudomonadota bacterium]